MYFKNLNFEEIPHELLSLPFVECAWIFIQETFRSVRNDLKAFPVLSSSPSIFSSLQYSLLTRIIRVILPTLISEMHLKASLGYLKARTSHERYAEFIRFAVQENFIRELFKHYPCLEEIIDLTLRSWKNFLLEFFHRLQNDILEIQSFFFEGCPLHLRHVSMDFSDEHDEGRTVCKVEFDHFTLFYKPKDISIEKNFNRLLFEIQEHGFSIPLKNLKVLAKEGYGWVEFIPHRSCTSSEEVKNFYIRSGINLFIWYLLEGTDAHYENLIACGEYPVMVDTETLFQPIFSFHVAHKTLPLQNSILRTGYLPFISASYEPNHGALTAGNNDLNPAIFFQWTSINTDCMQISQKNSPVMKATKHLPYFNEAPVRFIQYIDDIHCGFNQIFNFFIKNKKFFIQSATFQDLLNSKTRVVHRSTSYYSRLREYLIYPHNLKSKEVAKQFLEKHLISSPQEILESEIEQLLRRDIPYFYSFPQSKNVYAPDGTCFKNVLSYEPGLLVKKKISQLSKKEKLKQEKY